jgi:aminobenzoyl-glutamate transport protein
MSLPDSEPSPELEFRRSGFRILDWIERVGNRLPDPVTLFFLGAILVLIGSEVAVKLGWKVTVPRQVAVQQNLGLFGGGTAAATVQTDETVKSLLTSEGARWIWKHVVKNFTGFAPLGVVLVGMIGIGIAERAGLVGSLLKGLVAITPQSLLTPALVFVGVQSSIAMDAGFIVLPPLAAAVFAQAGRAPIVGLAAVFAGVAAGFSANLLITGLDPVLQSFTQMAAEILDPNYRVDIRCNYYFMICSTILLTLTGWWTTHAFVEPRFSRRQIEEQVAAARQSESLPSEGDRSLTRLERRGLLAAALGLLVAGGAILAMILIPGAPLYGDYAPDPVNRPDWKVTVWVDVIVPILFVLFLVPGVCYGIAAGTVRSDRDAAKMMGDTMASMGPYIVLAFFAGQFIAWFQESNLGRVLAYECIAVLQSLDLPQWLLVVGIILLSATLNMLVGSASAKWAMCSAVFVPVFMGVGISPELTQAAYRVGDSVTNTISPLNPYVVIILVFMRKYQPQAGIGSLISIMLPYTVVFTIFWTGLMLLWMLLDLPLGPGGAQLFLTQ